eukprot:CAMPEP_0170059214 /NCGR_PEP_ID=MMETSP0019_2-20121128/1573_1 /TAXON_ID=98059 /ORGANISM="Dinobryon sp., Strain UTEXLB2267" /LENGTH=279 /DNA_ID=CAMNT_0010264403 /DNA_START=2569 /DNA_END=3411 /DNA_ORIENTATION=+
MLRGDGVGANVLAQEGRLHGDLMKDFNALAVDEIMRDQDQDEDEDEIDLHGLFASEAVDVVKIKMDEAKPGHTLNFITGKGLNSDIMKGPVLKPAIEKLCIDQNWSYEYYEGCFSIEVPLEEPLPQIQEHKGLAIGDVIPMEAWKYLRDIEGMEFDFSRLRRHKPSALISSNYAVVFIDPRRSSAQTIEVINEFHGISHKKWGNNISLTIVTTDSANDLRKLVKKRKMDWCVMLSDEEKKFIEFVRCNGVNMIHSALLILNTGYGMKDVKSGKLRSQEN